MCSRIAEDGEVPVADVQKYNHSAIALFQRLGFVQHGENKCIAVNVVTKSD